VPRVFPTSESIVHIQREALLLEPDPLLGTSVRDALRRQGHRVTLIADGLHAVIHLQARLTDRVPLPRLVVTNMDLPGVDAFDVATSLHRAGCALILVTTRISEEVRARAKQVEALGLFRQPFHASDLSGFIAAHMHDD
jgi:DNA-binding response OmpR family regulator